MMLLVKIEKLSELNKDILERLVDVYHDAYQDLKFYYYKKRKDARWYMRWLYRRDSNGIFVAKIDDEIVGFIACDSNWDYEFGAIHEIAVRKNFQGKGIGSKLLKTGIDYLKKKGLRYVELYVGEKNIRAINFYKKFGFKEDGLFGIWLRMVLKL